MDAVSRSPPLEEDRLKRVKQIPALLLVPHTVILLSALHVSCPTAGAQRPGCRVLGVRSEAGVGWSLP